MRRHAWRRATGLAAVLVLAGCATPRGPETPSRSPAEIRAEIVRLMPASARDREGWATDIQVAFASLKLEPTTSQLCSVLAVTEQESTFTADPAVPNLPKIARAEIDRRAASMHVPRLVVSAALRVDSPNGKSYGERLDRVRSERELSELYEDLIGRVPLGQRLFGGYNPVRTGGPMQVGIAFAETHAKQHGYPYDVDGSIRREVFTRRGGMYFGIAHLLAYPTNYPKPVYRYADFNAGWYASRNAAFQSAVSRTTGIPLALDGDLVAHESREPGKTERAVRAMKGLDMSDASIRRALDKGDSLAFEETTLYTRVFELAEAIERKPLPREVIPRITLESPKITRTLTTEWFARRVEDRHTRCMARAKVPAKR